MEMTMEMRAEREIDAAVEMVSLAATMERLVAATELLERTVERLNVRRQDDDAGLGRIGATGDLPLEQRLAAVEIELAGLRAGAKANTPVEVTNGRKTLPVTMANLLAKQGVQVDSMEPVALDGALASLSVEQRIAVKSQLLRAGLVG
jgi:hypothetical protein